MRARLDRMEIAGSLGDIGTFLPLLLGMAAKNGLDFATGLFFAGAFNAVTGLLFSIPMAVQPMKAIAAIAIGEGLTPHQIVAAGAGVSAVVLLLGMTGLIEQLGRLVPQSLVRGIQLAVGLTLAMKGVQMVVKTGTFMGADSVATAVLASCVVLAFANSRRVPAALLLFVAGIVLACWLRPEVMGSVSFAPWRPHWDPPRWRDVAWAFPVAALPQIPLTVLNSVVAVCVLSLDLFPDRPATPRKVAVSVGMMNLVGAPFGAMPMCHGAGGLAGQYRFGARTNGAVLFLGCLKMALAIAFGSSLRELCEAFPASVLGVMLTFSGVELAVVVRDQTDRGDAFLMIVTAGVSLGLNNVAVGFVAGLLAWVALKVPRTGLSRS